MALYLILACLLLYVERGRPSPDTLTSPVNNYIQQISAKGLAFRIIGETYILNWENMYVAACSTATAPVGCPLKKGTGSPAALLCFNDFFCDLRGTLSGRVPFFISLSSTPVASYPAIVPQTAFNSDIWRLDSACDSQWDSNKCTTSFGFTDNPVTPQLSSLYPIVNAQTIFTFDAGTFIAPSNNPGSRAGLFFYTDTATSTSSLYALAFVPSICSVGTVVDEASAATASQISLTYGFGCNSGTVSGAKVFMPGSLIMRWHNTFGQTVTSVKLTIQYNEVNWHPTQTTMKVSYAHEWAENWYYTDIPGLQHTTSAACSNSSVNACFRKAVSDALRIKTALDVTQTGENRKVRTAIISGLNWQDKEKFFLKFTIDCIGCNASAHTRGDVLSVEHVDITPYVTADNDYSLAVKQDSLSVQVPQSLLFDSSPTPTTNHTFEFYFKVEAINYTVSSDYFTYPPCLPLGDQTLFEVVQNPVSSANNFQVLLNYKFPLTTDQASLHYPIVDAFYYTFSFKNLVKDSKPIITSLPKVYPFKWYHFAFVREFGINRLNSNVKFYLDGDLFYSSKNLSLGNWTVPGKRNNIVFGGLGNDFVGYIDEIRLWNVLRGPSDLRMKMDRKLTGTERGLKAYFDFDNQKFSSVVGNFDLMAYWNNSFLKRIDTKVFPVFSTETPLTVVALSGGSISCEHHYITAGGTMPCTLSIHDQFNSATMFSYPQFKDPTYFRVIVKSHGGKGLVGPVEYDSGNGRMKFIFVADKYQTGPVELTAYAGNDPFVTGSYAIRVVSSSCGNCQYRHSIPSGCQYTYPVNISLSGLQASGAPCHHWYSCVLGSRRFMRKNIERVSGGMCP